MQIVAYARTDCGPVRENNEDALLLDIENAIFVVADGMGGHAAGEVASWMAVETTHDVLIALHDPDETMLVRSFDAGDPADVMRERLRYSMNQASIQIRRTADERPETRGMGTTLVVLVLDGDRVHLAHVGDSRAYLWRNRRLTRLTRDHTVVQQEIDAGRLTPEMAQLLPHKHLLTQSVGFHGSVEPDTATRFAESGDVFILCTDGLTDVLDDEAIGHIIEQTDVESLADVLLEEALAAGTQDNTTVVVVGTK